MEVDNDTNERMPYQRTPEDIKSMIKLAKLNEKNLTELTQAVYYDENESNAANFKLLELNSHLLSTITEGKTLIFKGGLNEKVVLCTDTKTFEVKEAGISNSVLLVPDLKLAQATSTSPLKSPKNAANSSLDRSKNDSTDSIEDESLQETTKRAQESRFVKKIFHEYMECREVQPKFRKFGDLLQLTRYSGPENEYCIDRSLLFTFDQLLNTTQCSRQEFENGLELYRAFEIDGRIRVLEIDYEYRILSLMLGIVTENSWSFDAVDKDETLNSISNILAPPSIVNALFGLYTFPSVNQTETGKTIYTYREELVCRTIALNILQQGMKFHLDDFMQTWQGALPEGMSINENYLRGIGIIDRSNTLSVPCVRALIENTLTTNLFDRLKVLFKARERWTLDQIGPYIEYFATPQLTITLILAKHARSMTENGQRIYVCKHGL